VSESSCALKRSLLCLRLAAECRDLAAAASTPELRARVLRMTHLWEELAEQPAVEIVADVAEGDPQQDFDWLLLGSLSGSRLTTQAAP
jgi:hypothetical protein